MNPTTNKHTTATKPASSAAIVAQRDSEAAKITAIQTGVQADASDRKTRWQDYLNNPLSLDRPAAMALFHELQALTPMAVAFNDGMLDWQIREFDKRFFAEEKDVCLAALAAELDAALVPQPGYVATKKADLVASITKAWDRATGREDRDKLLADRDAQEAKLEVLETNIGYAKAAVARFASAPTPEHFGEVRSAIGFVKSALA